jgi:hypothetical protein
MKKLMYLLIIVINLLLNINLSAQESMLIEFGRPKMYCIFDKHKINFQIIHCCHRFPDTHLIFP